MSPALRLNDRTFEGEVLGSEVPVLVEFGASWCLACKAMEPVLDEIAGELSGRAKIARINVDQNPSWAGKFKISGVPTLMVFSSADIVVRKVGAMSKKQIRELIEPALDSG